MARNWVGRNDKVLAVSHCKGRGHQVLSLKVSRSEWDESAVREDGWGRWESANEVEAQFQEVVEWSAVEANKASRELRQWCEDHADWDEVVHHVRDRSDQLAGEAVSCLRSELAVL